MRHAKGMLGINALFLLLGVSHLLRYSEKVKFVHFLGIAAGGAMCGVALVGIIHGYLALTGRVRLGPSKPPEKEPPLTEKAVGA